MPSNSSAWARPDSVNRSGLVVINPVPVNSSTSDCQRPASSGSRSKRLISWRSREGGVGRLVGASSRTSKNSIGRVRETVVVVVTNLLLLQSAAVFG